MRPEFEAVLQQVGQIILDKDVQAKLAISCLLAQGHLLIEDLPGMGKTTLAQCLAKVFGLHYERVQFTSDLLPGDILGASVFDQVQNSFSFHKGPIFTQVLLTDEINRSTPKTQSALLEAMEEGQVSIDGETRALPQPFFVIATQNPLSQAGTYPLPESQLDRFLMCISLGYPSEAAERSLLAGTNPRLSLQSVKPAMTTEQLLRAQKGIDAVSCSAALLDYVQRLIKFTRVNEAFNGGLSPRGAMSLLRAARAWAYIDGREFVLPEDIQAVLPSVVEHRVQGYGTAQIHNASYGQAENGAESSGHSGSLSHVLIQSVEVVER